MGRTRRGALIVGAVLALCPATAAAAGAQSQAEAEKIATTLRYTDGTLVVHDAQIAMPRGYRFLSEADARKTLEDIYGNPPDDRVAGLVVPPKADVLTAPYVVVVTYVDEGHVSDHDAAGIDYAKMLTKLQQDEPKRNEERRRDGYPAVHLAGWAEQPRYDAATHKLYWARDLQFADDSGSDVLNYDVRVLGRESTLSLEAIADMKDVVAVRTGMQQVLRSATFTPGRRYEDYHKGDRTSELTVAALVAGGTYAAAKTGLIALLLAKAKFLVVGLVALLGAARRRLFGTRTA
jgi:uncharacterized membrane-anchored protein